MTADGVPDLVVTDVDEYQRQAVNLANHRNELNDLRSKLLAERDSCPLFDIEGFVRNLEATYLQMFLATKLCRGCGSAGLCDYG